MSYYVIKHTRPHSDGTHSYVGLGELNWYWSPKSKRYQFVNVTSAKKVLIDWSLSTSYLTGEVKIIKVTTGTWKWGVGYLYSKCDSKEEAIAKVKLDKTMYLIKYYEEV